jgi:hypothetical protein
MLYKRKIKDLLDFQMRSKFIEHSGVLLGVDAYGHVGIYKCFGET